MPSPDERSVGDDDGDDFPLSEGCFPGRTPPPEPEIGSAQVPPRDGGASSRKLLLIFSRARDTLYQKMGIGGLQVAHEVGARPGG